MTIDEEIRRGHEAERLLADPMLKGAFEAVESGLVEAIKRVAIGDNKTQHELVLSLQLLERVKGYIKETMETGKLARIQKETAMERAKRMLRRA